MITSQVVMQFFFTRSLLGRCYPIEAARRRSWRSFGDLKNLVAFEAGAGVASKVSKALGYDFKVLLLKKRGGGGGEGVGGSASDPDHRASSADLKAALHACTSSLVNNGVSSIRKAQA